jgi:hypothetical protein
MTMNKRNLILSVLLAGLWSCSDATGPVGPPVSVGAEFPGTYEVTSYVLVSDFGGTPTPGLYPDVVKTSARTEVGASAAVDMTNISGDPALDFLFTLTTAENTWCSAYIGWLRGPIDLNDFGNAISFRARTVPGSLNQGRFRVTLPNVRIGEDYDFYYADFLLDTDWKTYVLPFDSFVNGGYGAYSLEYALANNLQIQFSPPSGTSYKTGRVQIDDIRFVTRVERR